PLTIWTESRASCGRHCFGTRSKSNWCGKGSNTHCETSSKGRSPPCCFRANWRCTYPIYRAKRRTRCAASTSLPRKFVSSSKVPSEVQRRNRSTLFHDPEVQYFAHLHHSRENRSRISQFPHYNDAAAKNAGSPLPGRSPRFPGEIRACTGYCRHFKWHVDLHP